AVEEGVDDRSVGVTGVATLEQAEGDEDVEEVDRRARVKSELGGQFGLRLRAVGERGEHPELDRREERFRRPEAQAQLEQVLRVEFGIHAGAPRLTGGVVSLFTRPGTPPSR